MAEYHITTPLKEDEIVKLRAGDRVYISGYIYTGRDAAHKRMVNLINEGKPLPVDLENQIIYYVGPTPAKPGKVIGSAGPTTSYRMDTLTVPLLKKGLKGMIGKGKRSAEVKEALKDYKAVYFGAIGGAAALIAKCITEAEIVAYEDLGPEAIRRLKVKDFPAVVVNDCHGGDIYQEGMKKYKKETS